MKSLKLALNPVFSEIAGGIYTNTFDNIGLLMSVSLFQKDFCTSIIQAQWQKQSLVSTHKKSAYFFIFTDD